VWGPEGAEVWALERGKKKKRKTSSGGGKPLRGASKPAKIGKKGWSFHSVKKPKERPVREESEPGGNLRGCGPKKGSKSWGGFSS